MTTLSTHPHPTQTTTQAGHRDTASTLRTWTDALLRTGDDVGPTLARIALGLVILPHGLQKTLGWFGGYGFSGTLGFFTEGMGIPAVLAVLAIAAESLGALALLAGAATRVAAFGIGTVMTVAALTVHWQHGFFMNWYGAQAGEGIEFHVLALGLALVLLVTGGGRASVDGVLQRRCSR